MSAGYRQPAGRLRLLALTGAGVGLVWLPLAVAVLSGAPNWAQDFDAYRERHRMNRLPHRPRGV